MFKRNKYIGIGGSKNGVFFLIINGYKQNQNDTTKNFKLHDHYIISSIPIDE